MSAILGLFDASQAVDVELARSMAAQQRWRGAFPLGVVDEPSAVLAVSRFDWELSTDHCGGVLALEEDGLAVAADGCLFYKDDLRQRLASRGVSLTGATTSHFILAAYRAWGEGCAEHLEGNFAFILHDRVRSMTLCARDFAGTRPLFFARFGNTLVIASTVAAIVRHPACTAKLNLAPIGATAAGWLWSCGTDTCYEDIHVVPIATSIVWRSGKERKRAHWSPPRLDCAGASSEADAAAQLRELLARAVQERMSASGTTAVWMSGGRDSTAVFAAGKYVTEGDTRKRLCPVSISYPHGDVGREDEYIQSVAERWKSPICWLEADDIAMFDQTVERAALRDEPATSPYENWNVALARKARACGARIALDGNGGDQIFRVSDIYLADLLRGGRLLELIKELRAKRTRGKRYLFNMTVPPLLPSTILAGLGRVFSGIPSSHYIDYPCPAWIRQEFVERHQLVERERAALPSPTARCREAAEMRWFLTIPLAGYANGVLQQRLLEIGLETRSPLLDQRVIEFAFSRPRTDRHRGLEDKLLLRRSMRGLIPDTVLAPRDRRTGLTISYSQRSMRAAYPRLFRELLEKPLALEALGILDSVKLSDTVARFEQRRVADYERVALFHTLQTELWLRARR